MSQDNHQCKRNVDYVQHHIHRYDGTDNNSEKIKVVVPAAVMFPNKIGEGFAAVIAIGEERAYCEDNGTDQQYPIATEGHRCPVGHRGEGYTAGALRGPHICYQDGKRVVYTK